MTTLNPDVSKTRVGFGMRFFGIPRIGIFYFGLDRKISKSLRSGSGAENPENPEWKISKIPKSPGSGFILNFWNFQRKFDKSLKNLGFLRFSEHRDFFLSLGIFIAGIRDFLSLGIFIPGTLTKSPDLCQISGIFYLRDIPGSGFFSWDGISRQEANSE